MDEPNLPRADALDLNPPLAKPVRPKPDFTPRHDWELTYQRYKVFKQTGGTDQAFIKIEQIPAGSFGRKATGFKKRLREETPGFSQGDEEEDKGRRGGLKASFSSPSSSPFTRLQLGSALPQMELHGVTPRGFDGAIEKIKAAMPALADTLIEMVHAKGPGATAAAKIAVDLAAKAEEAHASSPYEVMSDAEIGARLLALWPEVQRGREDVASPSPSAAAPGFNDDGVS